jgi:3-methyl-2-oxobutanoate hydroxymethyltransferase
VTGASVTASAGGGGRRRPVSIADLRAYKERGERFIVVAAYDFLSAHILDEAGVPLVPVGDSFGMFALGHDTLLPVTLEDMIHHTRAVVRGVRHGVVVADLPFGSYEADARQALAAAVRLVKEAGAHAVKPEGGSPQTAETVGVLVRAGIPVMGHVGFSPQLANQSGGFRLHGESDEAVAGILADARRLEEAGAFAIVVERVPATVGRLVSEAVGVPTIGAGAGPHTDAQVILLPWLLGLTSDALPRWFRMPPWARQYRNLRPEILAAVEEFRRDVVDGAFPGPENSY